MLHSQNNWKSTLAAMAIVAAMTTSTASWSAQTKKEKAAAAKKAAAKEAAAKAKAEATETKDEVKTTITNAQTRTETTTRTNVNSTQFSMEQQRPAPIAVKLGADPEVKESLATYTQRLQSQTRMGGPESIAALQKLRQAYFKNPAQFENGQWTQSEDLQQAYLTALNAPTMVVQANQVFLSKFQGQEALLPQQMQTRIKTLRAEKTGDLRAQDKLMIVKDLNWLVDNSASSEALEVSRQETTQKIFALMDQNQDVVRQYSEIVAPGVRGQEILRGDISRFQTELDADEKVLATLSKEGKAEEVKEITRSVEELRKQLADTKAKLAQAAGTQETRDTQSIVTSHSRFQNQLFSYKAPVQTIEAAYKLTENRDEQISELAEVQIGRDDEALQQAYQSAVTSYIVSQKLKNPQATIEVKGLPKSQQPMQIRDPAAQDRPQTERGTDNQKDVDARAQEKRDHN
jgi:hypothetical protein